LICKFSSNHHKASSVLKLNFDVHLTQYCFYFPNLVCPKFDSGLGFSVCQDKSKSMHCFLMPSSISKDCYVSVSSGGVLRVR
jgi:hypothetical protein